MKADSLHVLSEIEHKCLVRLVSLCKRVQLWPVWKRSYSYYDKYFITIEEKFWSYEEISNVETSTWVSAAWVLGSFIWAILTVKLSITLPFLLVEAVSVGTAVLIWTTCWIFYKIRACSILNSASLRRTSRSILSQLVLYFFIFFFTLPLMSSMSSHRHSPHSGDSSEPSEQSMSWSHTKCLGIHCLFWHMNSFSASQVLLVYTGNRNKLRLSATAEFSSVISQKKADFFSIGTFCNGPTHCSQPWQSHQLHQDSPCLHHTSSAEAHTCGSRDTGKPQDCRFWTLWQHYGKVTWWYNNRKS